VSPPGPPDTVDGPINTEDRIDGDFATHEVAPDAAEAMANLRADCARLAKRIVSFTPAGREQALALTNLEQTMFWTSAAIARVYPIKK
jgi:hypothetical protein